MRLLKKQTVFSKLNFVSKICISLVITWCKKDDTNRYLNTPNSETTLAYKACVNVLYISIIVEEVDTSKL